MINVESVDASEVARIVRGEIERPTPNVIDLEGAKVVAVRDIEEGEDVHPWSSRDGGYFLILELVSGGQYETFSPNLSLTMDPAVKARLDAMPPPPPVCQGVSSG